MPAVQLIHGDLAQIGQYLPRTREVVVRGKAVGDPAAVAVDPSGFWLALAAGGTQEVLVFQRKAMSWSHGDPGDFLDSALEYPSRK